MDPDPVIFLESGNTIRLDPDPVTFPLIRLHSLSSYDAAFERKILEDLQQYDREKEATERTRRGRIEAYHQRRAEQAAEKRRKEEEEALEEERQHLESLEMEKKRAEEEERSKVEEEERLRQEEEREKRRKEEEEEERRMREEEEDWKIFEEERLGCEAVTNTSEVRSLLFVKFNLKTCSFYLASNKLTYSRLN